MSAEKDMKEFEPVVRYVQDGYARGIAIPWRAKMWIKIILSVLPFSYRFLAGLGIFRHGDHNVNLSALEGSAVPHFEYFKNHKGKMPKQALELGPGDSVGHALFAKSNGVNAMTLVDVGDFASNDADHYKAVVEYIGESNKSFDAPQGFSRGDILAFTNSEYKTNGLSSLKEIENQSHDFSFSQAVFEHIHRDEFQETMNELYRIHKPGSIARHVVDLHDHLGGALNSFRYSPKFWESNLVKGAGFYTNRLTMDEMLEMAEKAGFKNVRVEEIVKWQEMPTPINKIHDFASNKSEGELNICTFWMVMEK